MATSFGTLMVEFAKHLGHEVDDAWESPLEITIEDFGVSFAEYNPSGTAELLMYATLGIIPEEHELEICRGLLEANVLWAGTADATIGVNSATREAIISYRLPVDPLDGETLAVVASHFTAVALTWKAFVEGATDDDAAGESLDDVPGAMRV